MGGGGVERRHTNSYLTVTTSRVIYCEQSLLETYRPPSRKIDENSALKGRPRNCFSASSSADVWKAKGSITRSGPDLETNQSLFSITLLDLEDWSVEESDHKNCRKLRKRSPAGRDGQETVASVCSSDFQPFRRLICASTTSHPWSFIQLN